MLQISNVIKQVFTTAWNSLSLGNIAGTNNRGNQQRKRRFSHSNEDNDSLCDHIEEEEISEIPLRKKKCYQLPDKVESRLASTSYQISNPPHSTFIEQDTNPSQRELWSYVVGKPTIQQKVTIGRRLSFKMARRHMDRFSRNIKGSTTNQSISRIKVNQDQSTLFEELSHRNQATISLLDTTYRHRNVLDDHPVPVHDNAGYIGSPFANNRTSTADGVIRLEERHRFQKLVKCYTSSANSSNDKPFQTRFSDVKDILGRIDDGIVNEAFDKPSKQEKSKAIDDKSMRKTITIADESPIKHGPIKKDILSTPEIKEDVKIQPTKPAVDIFDVAWITKWRQTLSSDNLAREREISALENEVKKLESERPDSDISNVIKRRIEDESDTDPGLNPLTIEEQDQIDDALDIRDPRHTVSEMQTATITRGDLDSLADLNWLNDEVINGFMCLLKERSKSNKKLPQIHVFNTFFYPKLLKTKHQGVKRWTKKVDIFSLDLVLIPIHLNIHWCLAAIDFKKKEIRYYDSMKANNDRCLDELRQYIEAESLQKKEKPFDFTGWKMLNPKNIPEQMNGCDCGVFACKYAECLSRGGKFSFSQTDMPLIRQRIIHSLITKII